MLYVFDNMNKIFDKQFVLCFLWTCVLDWNTKGRGRHRNYDSDSINLASRGPAASHLSLCEGESFTSIHFNLLV